MTDRRTRASRASAAADHEPPAADAAADGLRILKKYPNRRLYDTRSSGYITLADVKQMVLGGERFVVRDAKSGDDLTRSILLQIILEEESGGVPMFTTPMLGQIIRFYGHTMQGLMGSYLEKNIQAFTDMQSRLADPARAVGGASFSPEVWSQFMNVQAPMMQSLMTSYLDQSKTLFVQMQDQMHKQTENLLPPGFIAPKR